MANISLAEKRLNLAIDLLSLTTVTAIFYILVFTLYCLSFRLSLAQLRDDRSKIKRQTVYTLVFQTVLLICATLDVIAQHRIAQVRYIDGSTLSGGPLGLRAALSVATLLYVMSTVSIIEILLILGVLVWRVWVIWSGARFVIPLTIASVFFYLGSAGLAISADVLTWHIDLTSIAAAPRADFIISSTAPVFSTASSVFMSSTIIARLLFIRQKHIKLIGKSDIASQYWDIAAMIIEPYALDTSWNIGGLISFGLKNAPSSNFFSKGITQVDILTNFLVIYRVLSGRAWTRETHDRLSTLRWGSNGAGTTTSRTVDLPQTSPPAISFRDDGCIGCSKLFSFTLLRL